MNLQQLYIFLVLREKFADVIQRKIGSNEVAEIKVCFVCLMYSIN